MRDYGLLKLIELAGGQVDSRKRIQKAAFLLQKAGYPLNERFIWHHYGPYSYGVADFIGEATARAFLEETPKPLGNGTRYQYALTSAGKAVLHDFEGTRQGRGLSRGFASSFSKVEPLVRSRFPLRTLELGASLLYWTERGASLDKAVGVVAKAKREPQKSSRMIEARRIAAQFVGRQGANQCQRGGTRQARRP